ncbi:hypothetical protein [Rhodoferax sp.]|uniref:hypothetical protein n=1 Tax=Rhodoferax sp. TaxID=50421 RepID=UPI00284B51B1|nr:hypothetical protein [Rhodoferax sp.]MDR3369057.1 hypothetical protein [Rhodoferax sp.]
MARKGRIDDSREPGGYCALPWSVIDSQAFQSLSYPAVALLIELARQYVRNNNGRLLLSANYLRSRQWHSKDVIERARRELLDVKLIYQTVQGHRPNKASWYALTWYTLDRLPDYDAGAVEGFRRGMYASFQLPTPAPTREALFEKWRGYGVTGQKKPASKIDRLSPADGAERAAIAPAGGVESLSTAPAHGAIRALLPTRSTPANGHHLDKPFCTADSVQSASLQSTAQATDDDAANEGSDFERVHDCDLDPTRFDSNTGDFCPPPKAPARQQKQAADRWVKTALNQSGK